jgi:glucose/mannose-6-phosphate isomerase
LEEQLVNLDDPGTYLKYDPAGMLDHIHNVPELCRKAWQMAMDFRITPDFSGINKVVILGMGGSAMGGDLVSGLAIRESKVPILVCRDYNLPGYVDEKTLVIASSYSGLTEETLSAFEQALKTPAKKLAITTGGRLKTLCEDRKVPVFSFDYKTQPRAALPFSLLTILGLMQRLDILKDKYAGVSEMLFKLKDIDSKINEKVPSSTNRAKSFARKLYGRLSIIYGAGLTTEVAHRWKTQINENSKAAAFYEFFPELNHNSVVGYPLPEEIARRTMVIILDSDLLHPRVRLRFDITRKLLEQAGISYEVLSGEGESALSQTMGLVLFGDYVSYYLAMLNRVDPTPVKAIDFLKGELSKL